MNISTPYFDEEASSFEDSLSPINEAKGTEEVFDTTTSEEGIEETEDYTEFESQPSDKEEDMQEFSGRTVRRGEVGLAGYEVVYVEGFGTDAIDGIGDPLLVPKGQFEAYVGQLVEDRLSDKHYKITRRNPNRTRKHKS